MTHPFTYNNQEYTINASCTNNLVEMPLPENRTRKIKLVGSEINYPANYRHLVFQQTDCIGDACYDAGNIEVTELGYLSNGGQIMPQISRDELRAMEACNALFIKLIGKPVFIDYVFVAPVAEIEQDQEETPTDPE